MEFRKPTFIIAVAVASSLERIPPLDVIAMAAVLEGTKELTEQVGPQEGGATARRGLAQRGGRGLRGGVPLGAPGRRAGPRREAAGLVADAADAALHAAAGRLVVARLRDARAAAP